MLHNKIFTVSIGDHGTIVALHDGGNVYHKILIASIDDKNKTKLQSIFDENKSAPIYIILDSVNQNYNKKTYPPVSRLDFHRIAKRDLGKDIDQDQTSFQSYYGVKNKLHNKWDCTFVSSPNSPETEHWIKFLLTLSKHLVGIYMLPLEMSNFALKVFNAIKIDHKLPNSKNIITLVIVYNKISGVRQIVFFNQSIVFTRVVNYDFDDPVFCKNFEDDIFRVYEYLLILFPKLKPKDFIVINILSRGVINQIKSIHKKELTFINYSPFQIANKLGIINAVPKDSGMFSDIIIANCFASSKKKILKFSTPEIKKVTKFCLISKSILTINILICVYALYVVATIYAYQYRFKNQISDLNNTKSQLTAEFQVINNAALDNNKESNDKELANRIIDFGKINDVLSAANVDIFNVFDRLSLVKKYEVLISSIDYHLPKFDPKAQKFLSKGAKFTIKGEISDQSGDVETLFKKFDALGLKTRNKFLEYNVVYSSISKNVDFSKKYYSFPIQFTLENKESSPINDK